MRSATWLPATFAITTFSQMRLLVTAAESIAGVPLGELTVTAKLMQDALTIAAINATTVVIKTSTFQTFNGMKP